MGQYEIFLDFGGKLSLKNTNILCFFRDSARKKWPNSLQRSNVSLNLKRAYSQI
jgi:hypothetical protein